MACLPRRRVVALAVGLWAALGAPSASRADAPAQFVWVAPAECPGRESVLARIRRVANTAQNEAIVGRARVEPTSDGRWMAHVATPDDASGAERILEATSCDAIADAVALIVGLSFPPPPREPPLLAVSPASVPSVAFVPARRVSAARGASGLLARASAVANGLSLPAPTAGVALGLAWRTAHVAVGVEGAAFVSQRGFVSSGPSSSGASFALAAASVDVCLPVPLGDRIVMDPCAGLTVQRLAASGFGQAGTFRSSQPVLALAKPTAEIGLEWWASPLIGFRAAARGLFSVVQTTFVVNQPSDTTAPPLQVFRQGAIAFEGSLAVVVPLTSRLTK